MNRKAISSLIATVLMILITIAIVGIVVAAVMPMFRGTVDKAALCKDAELSVNKDYTVFNETSAILSITLSRGAKEVQINRVQIKLRDGAGRSAISEQTGIPVVNGDQSYDISNNTLGIGKPVAVGLAPIVLTGKTEYVCPMQESNL